MYFFAQKLLLFLSLAGLLVLFGCSLFGNDDEPRAAQIEEYFAAKFNGETWEAQPGAGIKSLAGFNWLQVWGVNPQEEIPPYAEFIDFSVAFSGTGTYSLVGVLRDREQSLTSGSYYAEHDGDAVIADYHPTDDASDNRLEITGYDKETGIVEGTFRTTLVVEAADRDVPERRQADTLRFTDGRFRVHVRDRRE